MLSVLYTNIWVSLKYIYKDKILNVCAPTTFSRFAHCCLNSPDVLTK